MPVADTMEAEEVVEELWREIWREMVPNWDMGMGPKPGPWGTEAEDVATVGEDGSITTSDRGLWLLIYFSSYLQLFRISSHIATYHTHMIF